MQLCVSPFYILAGPRFRRGFQSKNILAVLTGENL
jgi:hypothetical protein